MEYSQALLEELRQAGADHAQTDNSGSKTQQTTDYAAEFGPSEWAALAQRADSLRKLVRIKVADDNDLKTARAGFLLCAEFFDGLGKLAELMNNADEFDVLKDLDVTA